MSKNFVTILFLTLITLLAWVAFQVFKITTATTIPAPTQEQIRALDPKLDKSVLEDLKKAVN